MIECKEHGFMSHLRDDCPYCETSSASSQTRSPVLDEHDWLQIEQAASGCVSGTSDEWPDLRTAISKLTGKPFGHRRSAAWLQGFCEGVLIQSDRSIKPAQVEVQTDQQNRRLSVDDLISFCEPCSSRFFGKIVRRTIANFPDLTEPAKTASELEALRRCVSLIEAIHTGKIRIE